VTLCAIRYHAYLVYLLVCILCFILSVHYDTRDTQNCCAGLGFQFEPLFLMCLLAVWGSRLCTFGCKLIYENSAYFSRKEAERALRCVLFFPHLFILCVCMSNSNTEVHPFWPILLHIMNGFRTIICKSLQISKFFINCRGLTCERNAVTRLWICRVELAVQTF